MENTTTYQRSELKRGKCSCCSEISSEILTGDGRCLDCIESENFYNETMKGL